VCVILSRRSAESFWRLVRPLPPREVLAWRLALRRFAPRPKSNIIPRVWVTPLYHRLCKEGVWYFVPGGFIYDGCMTL
jgi:hypothetical protein